MKLSELNRKNIAIQTRLNSLYYVIDLKKKLKEKGILKGGFLAVTKVADLSPVHFNQSIDLRNRTGIIISAREHNLNRINKIVIIFTA